MCGNRVEELESRVQELEASVEGLTDELVECKVRLRELEGAVDEDLGFGPTTSSSDSTKETEDVTPDDTSVGAEMVDASEDQPFDESATESPAEGTKTEATDSDNKSEESESDIIVA